jgi:hypothetical protein
MSNIVIKPLKFLKLIFGISSHAVDLKLKCFVRF